MTKLNHKTRKTYYRDIGNEWRWRIQARNQRIIHASSEGFKRKADAERNWRLVVRYVLELVND